MIRYAALVSLSFLSACVTTPPSEKPGLPPASLTAQAVDATWERAYVYLPADLNPFKTGTLGGRRDLTSIGHALAALEGGPKRPVVVYSHGCGGFGNSGKTNASMLAEAGYVVIGPDSFARPERIQTCDGKRKVGIGPKGIYSQVIGMRIAEIDRVLQGLSGFSWVDWDNIFLFGHSQGSNAVASYKGDLFKGRVMTGTRCSRGYKAPKSEPGLAIWSAGDPWFRGRRVRCVDYVGKTALQVMELPGREHVVVRVPEARAKVVGFLKSLTKGR